MISSSISIGERLAEGLPMGCEGFSVFSFLPGDLQSGPCGTKFKRSKSSIHSSEVSKILKSVMRLSLFDTGAVQGQLPKNWSNASLCRGELILFREVFKVYGRAMVGVRGGQRE